MMLNYLYANFLEETAFARHCGISQADLNDLIKRRVFPAPSYIYDATGHSVSFVSDVQEDAVYRFHLKGHASLLATVKQLGLNTEKSARQHFDARFDLAKTTFLAGPLGQELTTIAPHIPGQFNADHATSTWAHFLNGVYGVCTRDGQPESIFLKQAGVMFIDELTSNGPGALTSDLRDVLGRAVEFLDAVESDFAPNEVAQTSRQRCIIDVRARFLSDKAA